MGTANTTPSTGEAKVLVAGTFEGGFQPLSLAQSTARLQQAGHEVETLDTFVEGVREDRLADADFVAVSMSMFQSVESGIELAKLAAQVNPTATVCCFGKYATLSHEHPTFQECMDYIIRGDWETPLAKLVAADARNEEPPEEYGICYEDRTEQAYTAEADEYVVPDRTSLPELSKYSYDECTRMTGEQRIVGNVEASRGCRYSCTYCSVFAAYKTRNENVPADVVLEDVRNLVESGAEHICFMDAEFLNDPAHAEEVTRRLDEEFPKLSFDMTTRIDHFAQHRELLSRINDRGLSFITTALEYPDEDTLEAVNKRMTMDEVYEGIEIADEIGIPLNPTFITFNPWENMDDMDRLTEFLEETDLEDNVSQLQLETRLYIYKGSPLLNLPSVKDLELQEGEFSYEWKHPDSKVDQLFDEVQTSPEEEDDDVFKRCCIKC